MLVARPPNTARCRGGCSGDAALVVCCCRGRPSTAGLLAAVETARRTSFATVPVWIYGSTTVWVYNTRAMDGGSCLAIPISIVIIVEPSQLSNAAKPRENPKKPHSNAWRLGHRLELRPQEGRHQEELRDRGGRRRGAGARGCRAASSPKETLTKSLGAEARELLTGGSGMPWRPSRRRRASA